jgi:hypothetical protein
MSLVMGTKCSREALAFGGAVVRLAYGGPVEEPLRQKTLDYLRLMDVPVPAKVESGTLYAYARLYDRLVGSLGAVRARNRRDRIRLVVAWSVLGLVSIGSVSVSVLRFGWSAGAFVALVCLLVVRLVLRRRE